LAGVGGALEEVADFGAAVAGAAGEGEQGAGVVEFGEGVAVAGEPAAA
jgi:hypothetical protein